VKKLAAVSQQDLCKALENINFKINEERFNIGMVCYGTTVVVDSLPPQTFRNLFKMPDDASDAQSKTAQLVGAVVLRAYTCFVYMWNDVLERGLDAIPQNSPAWPYREFFRRGCQDNGDDSIAQHIRNSLAHSTFEIRYDRASIRLVDRNWSEETSLFALHQQLCPLIKDFYLCAYQVKYGLHKP